jgi:hypothetical protein
MTKSSISLANLLVLKPRNSKRLHFNQIRTTEIYISFLNPPSLLCFCLQNISQPKFCMSFLFLSSELCGRSVRTNFELAFIVDSILPYFISLRSEYFSWRFVFQVSSSKEAWKSSEYNELSYQHNMKTSVLLSLSLQHHLLHWFFVYRTRIPEMKLTYFLFL